MRALQSHESYCCSRGCGDCQPKPSRFEYSREEFPDGRVISKSDPCIVSSCCGAPVEIWDEKAQRTLDEPVEP